MSERTQVHAKSVLRYMRDRSFHHQNKALLAALTLIPTSALLIGTAIPFTISNILAALAQNTPETIKNNLVLFTIFAVVAIIANRIGFYALLTSQASTLEKIHEEILDSLLARSPQFYANRMTGKIISDATTLTDAFIHFQDSLAINIIPFLITMAGGIAVISFNSPILGFGLFIMTISVIATALVASKRRKPLREARHESQRKLRGYFADVIINNDAVRYFARENEERKQHQRLNVDLKKRRIRDWALISFDGNNRIIAILAMQAIFIIVIVRVVQNNPALLASGIFAFTFSITLTNKLFDISSMIRTLEASVVNASSMVAMINEPLAITDAVDAKSLQVNRGDIRLADVTFKYDDSNSALFSRLNLHIKPGEKVGLVGHSGGGKTTITKLLLRFMDINKGTIAIDGHDISKVTQASLREHIAYVPQEPMLFHRSLAENIAYGRPDATRREIEVVAKMAHAHEFISALPEGYDTLVGERGVKLSGGQRQRVAIARAMLKNAPILILDEATSALDSESESYIQDALWKLMEGRTAIVIAHRLSTIQKMDRIIVMDNGEIAEQGTHKELVRQDGIYASLWAHQSGGFLEE